MRLINIRPNFVAAYNEKWLKRGADKQSAIKIVERAKEFVRRENRKRIALEIGTEDDYSDWREESGWNDVYGSDVEMSDIIEFRD